MNLISKIRAMVSDLGSDVDFLRRKDVSTTFKILNFLSGDRLRILVAFAGIRLHDIEREFEHLEKCRDIRGGEPTKEDYETILHNIRFYAKKTKDDVLDIFMI